MTASVGRSFAAVASLLVHPDAYASSLPSSLGRSKRRFGLSQCPFLPWLELVALVSDVQDQGTTSLGVRKVVVTLAVVQRCAP